jgi:proteasome lid subunit RPN8/RPN11
MHEIGFQSAAVPNRQTMNTLRMPRTVYRELRAHGEECYPNECCGALLGRRASKGWQIVSLVHAANAHTGAPRTHFEIAPTELVAIVSQARGLGLEVAGFYHSHPDQAAQPSATDLAEAHWLGCITVITEVAARKSAATAAFVLAGAREEEKRFEPLAIEFEIGASVSVTAS